MMFPRLALETGETSQSGMISYSLAREMMCPHPLDMISLRGRMTENDRNRIAFNLLLRRLISA